MERLFLLTSRYQQNLTMEEWLQGKATALRPIATRWFDEIKNCGGDVQDIFHDGYPVGCVLEAPFAYVNTFSAHVNVGFFYGADLPDPGGLLEGTGKHMRHVKIKPGQPCDEKQITTLIKAAYNDIRRRLHET